MDIKQAKELLQRYQTGNISPSEKELIERWFRQLVETGEFSWSEEEKTLIREKMEADMMKKIQPPADVHRIRFVNTRLWWAASVAVLLGTGLYFLFVNNKTAEPSPVVQATTVQDDVPAPRLNRAMITLSNGQTVYLDSMDNGAVVTQGNVKLVKLSNGEIKYEPGRIADAKVQYNTLFNPRGSKVIYMLLTDGTKVWLNAGSSLKYPVVFTGNKREVSVTGEAYFEVAKNKAKPFEVHAGDVKVEVLGTHFNINAYSDENVIETSLLEGGVKVAKGGLTDILQPGQQAIFNKELNDLKKVKVEMDGVLAWKNGLFQFDGDDIAGIMRQISRWYDVEVICPDKMPVRHFEGKITRSTMLSDVLHILELSGVKFRVEGKRITVQ